MVLCPKDDFERRPAAGRRDEAKTTADRRGPRAHVLQPLAGGDVALVEAGAVIDDGHEALARTFLDPHLGALRAGVLARVREPFLDDAEHLDLLVRREPYPALDLEVDPEPAVGGEEVDIAAQGGVERRRAGRGREREDSEARLLLRGRGGLLQLGERPLRVGTALEHRRVRRHGEEVLREPVVDLARDAGALLRHGAAELRVADRAPHAHEQHRVGEQAQEVALRDVAARELRREDVVELGEQRQRRAQAEPAVEVVAAGPEAEPEADHRHQRQNSASGERGGEQQGLVVRVRAVERRECRARLARDAPAQREHDGDAEQHLAESTPAGARATGREGRRRDQHPGEEPPADPGPRLDGLDGVTAEHRRDREGEHRGRRRAEAAAEQEVEPPPFHGEPDPGEQGHDRGGQHHDRVEHEPHLRERVAVAEARIGDEQRERSTEQPGQEQRAPQPGLVVVARFLPHKPLVGSRSAADKGRMRILLVDDHPITRAALSALLESHGFSVVGEAADGEEAIEAARRLAPELVVLDLSMPGSGGLQALPRIREAAPEAEVVVLTASGTEENLLAAIRAGAAGYLLKSEPPERIAEFLRGVAQGEAALSGEIARRLLEQVREGGTRRGVPEGIARSLSARELEVLLLLDEHLGTDEIAARLFISEHTVRSHVKSLLRKLNVSSRREALDALATARAA